MLHSFRKIRSAVGWRWRCRRAVAAAHRDTRANLAAYPIRRVLVVCYGNIYRSPFVAEYLRQACGDRLDVRSAGFHPRPGRASPPRHVEMSRAHGLDLSGHLSVVTDPSDVAWADVIVLMDRHNWQALQLMGATANRLVWLGALDDGPVEIPDPYGLDEVAAGRILGRLESCAARLAECFTSQRADGKLHDLMRPTGDGAIRGG